MIYFLKVVRAEMVKQHKNYFHNKSIYISLFFWPMLVFLSTYYGYKPFNMDKIRNHITYLNSSNVILFVLIGYVSMSFFRSLVQSAWRFSTERIFGTLELIYLTPGNRLAFVLGNAISSVFESVWLFVVFSGVILYIKGNAFNANIASALIGIMLVIVLSLLWGMLLNSLFLYSRDTGFLFTILEEPMEIFAGIKVPTAVFPLWAKGISYVFPLTYAAELLRRALLNNESIYDLKNFILVSIIIGAIMMVITIFFLKTGEAHAKETGSMSLF
ncbi:ABC transporter permease [Clostridium sp. YIM B02515]|uniref:Transport permease protein n=1 Tax=Clostridium rhizosphaerae TaxID=2803861 RepID=A0ABS1T4A9_9CLOT|nr:ABC transporter permease [Clostridium rhizosphaerae]MBL4934156.1 ABC transporter permease [Clostridium rhizosphaerae]